MTYVNKYSGDSSFAPFLDFIDGIPIARGGPADHCRQVHAFGRSQVGIHRSTGG